MSDEITLLQVLEIVDTTRPNTISDHIKTDWINEIERKAIEDIFNRAKDVDYTFTPYDIERDFNKVLKIPRSHSDVYTAYLYGKIDFTLGETARYQNDVLMFEAAYSDLAASYRRTHYPKPI